MSYQGFDPDEVDRAAHVLGQSREQVQQHAKRVRASIHGISRFQGSAADKARAYVDQVAKRLDQDARDLDEVIQALKTLAAQARLLNR
ncbi:WXG100 family type VII secretion target [Amycolatopsis sp. NBC_01286]|uniref:WXG100 family type VII secretion target n=1 Tax=Amycolatopsis sp. NBC_01286 TaxID=2903560 RepID=UPI002E0D9490|nr:WXG100 family type VII secretion target [Amycolatopsis sp. NBC_01286]